MPHLMVTELGLEPVVLERILLVMEQEVARQVLQQPRGSQKARQQVLQMGPLVAALMHVPSGCETAPQFCVPQGIQQLPLVVEG
jgi:hypothetical protein